MEAWHVECFFLSCSQGDGQMSKVPAVSAKAKAAKPKPGIKPAAKRERQQTTLVSVVIVAVLAFLGLLVVLFAQINGTGVKKGNYTELAQLTTRDGTPILGDPTVPVIFREFANFSCSACLQYHATVHEVIERWVTTGQARLEVRAMIWEDPASTSAGLAAMCALRQGRFWDYHDALFNEVAKKGANAAFDLSNLRNIAAQLDMDSDKLLNCVVNKDTLPQINANMTLSTEVGLTGTPGVMYSIDGGQSFKWFSFSENGQVVTRTVGGVPLTSFEDVLLQAQRK
jgi:protein-disulfide isomerase